MGETKDAAAPDGKAKGVLVVDDQPLYREGLRGVIEYWKEFDVVGEASNGREACERYEKLAPDIVLMDVRMPDMDGVQAASSILAKHPEACVVMLTVSVEDSMLVPALRAGVRGYMTKDVTADALRASLLKAARGEAVLSGSAVEGVMQAVARSDQAFGAGTASGAPDTVLSDDEVELLGLVAEGLSNEEIGESIFMSSSAVKKRIRALNHKLGSSNRVQLAVYAVHHGFAKRRAG